MPKYIAMQVSESGAPLAANFVQPAPLKSREVRVEIAASGVCHADIGTAAASGKHTVFPVTPGHEIAGTIAEIGENVSRWTVGDRVAIGWFGGNCGDCAFCRAGDPVHCRERKIPGVSYAGGWAQNIVVPAEALAAIPDGMDFYEAAPMGCAGVTTFNALRNLKLDPGAAVAVFGIGGLVRLAIQFAAKMGYRTITIARGLEREELARQLGANHYIDSNDLHPGQALFELGGADLILSTASTTEPLSELSTGLSIGGQLTIIGVDGGDITVSAAQLMMNRQIITGHLTGSANDTEQTMKFAHLHGVKPLIERMPLDQANEAIARISAGKPRFRIVLEPNS